MFLPVRFCRVSFSLIFIWTHEHTEQFINIFFLCVALSVYFVKERKGKRVPYLIKVLLLAF